MDEDRTQTGLAIELFRHYILYAEMALLGIRLESDQADGLISDINALSMNVRARRRP